MISPSFSLQPFVCVMCGENHEYHELYPLNKLLSVQHNIVNSRYNAAW